MPRRPVVFAAPLAALVLLVSTAAVPPAAAAAPLTARSLQERLVKLDEAARQGRWEQVERDSGRLLAELVESLSARASNDEANRLVMANVLSLRALAESARGEERLAVWDWWMAQSLWPEIRRYTLTSYGAPAELLRRNLAPEEPPRSAADCAPAPAETCHVLEETDETASVSAPRKLSAPKPAYPLGARVERIEGSVVLQTVIDASGRTRQPRILVSPAPSFAVAAAEVLRDWTFEPAVLGGAPVAVYYNLTVNFDLRGVPPLRPARPTVRSP